MGLDPVEDFGAYSSGDLGESKVLPPMKNTAYALIARAEADKLAAEWPGGVLSAAEAARRSGGSSG
ncbi:hypothetical protein [Kitasatospora cineracea]|uniref:hypothetical protein n=1 Tax=Kitasatospora cineracea TaxID=88074 RepID=UPI00340106FB